MARGGVAADRRSPVSAPDRWSSAVPLAACLLLASWLVWSLLPVTHVAVAVLAYLCVNLIVYTDVIDYSLRRYMHRRRLAARAESEREAFEVVSIDLAARLAAGDTRPGRVRPYAIVASVFNFAELVDDFIEAYGPYRERVWLVSDGSTDDTVRRLHQLGWRCLDEALNRRKPGALRRLLTTLPPEIETVMVVDPDTRVRLPGEGSRVRLESAIRDFQCSGAAAMAPRIMIERDGFIGRFQAFEYALACGVGRLSLGELGVTSGVAVYRRDALERALAQHSLSVYAEDFENAVLLLSAGEQVYYDGRLAISTTGVGSWRRWFSQRVGWYYGLVKVYAERLPEILAVARRSGFARYNYVAYLGVLSIALHALRVVSMLLLTASFANALADGLGFDGLSSASAVAPISVATAAGSYLALGAVAWLTVVPPAERAYVLPVVPLYLFYALAHVAPMTVGFLNWAGLRYFDRRFYRDHYA